MSRSENEILLNLPGLLFSPGSAFLLPSSFIYSCSNWAPSLSPTGTFSTPVLTIILLESQKLFPQILEREVLIDSPVYGLLTLGHWMERDRGHRVRTACGRDGARCCSQGGECFWKRATGEPQKKQERPALKPDERGLYRRCFQKGEEHLY